jgi:predicted nucleic acid-binding protein
MIRLPVTGQLIEQAVDLARRYRLRGADALHLTAALQLHGILTGVGESVFLVSSDDELLKAALGHGLQVENPAARG